MFVPRWLHTVSLCCAQKWPSKQGQHTRLYRVTHASQLDHHLNSASGDLRDEVTWEGTFCIGCDKGHACIARLRAPQCSNIVTPRLVLLPSTALLAHLLHSDKVTQLGHDHAESSV